MQLWSTPLEQGADYDFSISNEELLELVKRQDQEALRLLFRRHERPIYSLLFRMLNNHEDAEEALGKAHITVNKNAVPFDTQSPFITSGIRIGTPAVTTRGFGTDDMKTVARWIDRAVRSVGDDGELGRIASEVHEICGKYPLYPGLE